MHVEPVIGGVVDAVAVARSMRGSIGMLAMPWLMAESTQAQAIERGLPAGHAAYAVGRLGVLGNCPVDNVVGAAFFWEPDYLRSRVIEGRSTTDPRDGAAVYTEICQEWGAERLAGFDGVERLAELCERVVDTASPLGAPLFVGWRDQPRPADGPARAFQLCQVMRELRFSRHTVAVQAAGMSPLEAILSGPAGEWNADLFGWKRPFPDVSGSTVARELVESATDRLHAHDLEVLGPDARAELRALAKAARAHAHA
jgi:hypothetical protein